MNFGQLEQEQRTDDLGQPKQCYQEELTHEIIRPNLAEEI